MGVTEEGEIVGESAAIKKSTEGSARLALPGTCIVKINDGYSKIIYQIRCVGVQRWKCVYVLMAWRRWTGASFTCWGSEVYRLKEITENQSTELS